MLSIALSMLHESEAVFRSIGTGSSSSSSTLLSYFSVRTGSVSTVIIFSVSELAQVVVLLLYFQCRNWLK